MGSENDRRSKPEDQAGHGDAGGNGFVPAAASGGRDKDKIAKGNMPRRPKTTMRDVARLAGVSVATVSAVLNGTPRVSDHRKQRVVEAMDALDYYPDGVARSLKKGLTQVIGMVIPDLTNEFYPQVIRGVEDAARERGYSLILCDCNEDPEQEKRHLDVLFSRRVDGVLIACSNSAGAYEHLSRRRFPVVFFDRIPHGWQGGAVCSDDERAAYGATKHLIELGHTRIGIVAGRQEYSTHAARLEGFRKAMQEARLLVHDEYFRTEALSIEKGYEYGKEFFRCDPAPTAILATNNRALLGLIRAAGECKVSIPDSMSLVGFDDYAWTQNFSPGLTTIAQPTWEIGRRALEMLVDRIEGREASGRSSGQTPLRLQSRLVVRGSTAPPRRHPSSLPVAG